MLWLQDRTFWKGFEFSFSRAIQTYQRKNSDPKYDLLKTAVEVILIKHGLLLTAVEVILIGSIPALLVIWWFECWIVEKEICREVPLPLLLFQPVRLPSR